MQVEVGEIYEGKVTGITGFGAFVEFAEGKTGMVHISEVAATFVKDINDFIKIGQAVKVKVINISEDGKIGLSIKKAEPPRPVEQRQERRPAAPRRFAPRPPVKSAQRPGDFEWQSKPNMGGDFEDMMAKFKQTSDEKISDLKKSSEIRKGSSRRSGGGGGDK